MGKTYSIRKVRVGASQAELWKKKMSVGLFSTFRHSFDIGRKKMTWISAPCSPSSSHAIQMDDQQFQS